MKWIKAKDEKPRTDVDVHVVTEAGVKGVARYWDITGHWLTQDARLKSQDKVVKWKYAEAT